MVILPLYPLQKGNKIYRRKKMGVGKYYLPKVINKTEISLGLTPEIRDACPMVAGRIFVNFSFDSDEILFKEK